MQTLLFDLGGVVIDYRGPERLARLSHGAMSLEDAGRTLSSSETLHAFERGEISPEDFAQEAVLEWRLDATPESFIADFETWPERVLPGAREAVEALADRFALACLSNINVPHWRRVEALGVSDLFERAFLSHELGARKPGRDVFERTLMRLGLSADEIVFFDDIDANIKAAKSFGIRAFNVSLQEGLRGALREAGLA